MFQLTLVTICYNKSFTLYRKACVSSEVASNYPCQFLWELFNSRVNTAFDFGCHSRGLTISYTRDTAALVKITTPSSKVGPRFSHLSHPYFVRLTEVRQLSQSTIWLAWYSNPKQKTRAVFKWLSKVITWLRLLRLVIGLKESRQFFNQWEAKPKPIAPSTRDFSHASSNFR